MNERRKWVHFIGIAGVTTGQLAVEFKSNGYLVSGSDRGLFPPMSTHIQDNGVNIELGYKSEHLELGYYKNKYKGEWLDRNEQNPDFVVMQGVKGYKNKEYLYAIENNIPVKYYTDILQEMVIVPERSIVVSGTYGKTTTTTMLAWIFETAGKDFSYMYGALNDNLGNGVRFHTSPLTTLKFQQTSNPSYDKKGTITSELKAQSPQPKYSIVEGDEYISSLENPVSKFFFYSPKYLILTSAQWDHSDIFKTKQDYLDNMQKLVEMIPEDGVIIYNNDSTEVLSIIKNAKCEIISYSVSEISGESKYDFISEKLNLIGKHNLENAFAATKMAEYMEISLEDVSDALASFSGIKRRLEIKYKSDSQIVIDDFGASPSKAESAISAVVDEFTNYEVVAVFEPNLGSRTVDGIKEYQEAFCNKGLKKLYLPRFTKVKGEYLSNIDLADYIKKQGVEVEVIDDDKILLEKLMNLKDNNCIIFMGSHGFRGMIDELVSKLTN